MELVYQKMETHTQTTRAQRKYSQFDLFRKDENFNCAFEDTIKDTKFVYRVIV